MLQHMSYLKVFQIWPIEETLPKGENVHGDWNKNLSNSGKAPWKL